MDFTHIFHAGIQNSEEFREALDIAQKNSYGYLWLVGGFLYRTVATELYGITKPVVDVDFVAEVIAEDFFIPEGWKKVKTTLGSPRFRSGLKQVDLIPLSGVHSIIHRNLQPTIENYLTGVPLTVQSLAYDIHEEKVIGERGIDALQQQVVEVNYLEGAQFEAQRKGLTLEALVKEKAFSLGFTAVVPYEPGE
ncbi:hypothetical protein HYT55_04935 [Candidatus Woesearchaeota archaeon]|nr:hypothetical protein [Candidatus Woesearchaeota archaeon]